VLESEDGQVMLFAQMRESTEMLMQALLPAL
jgi:hypothetical protein